MSSFIRWVLKKCISVEVDKCCYVCVQVRNAGGAELAAAHVRVVAAGSGT